MFSLSVWSGCLSLPGLPKESSTEWWLEQQKCVVSQFWRLEFQDQGVSRSVLPLKELGKAPLASRALLSILAIPWLVEASPHPLMAFSLCVCLSVPKSPLYVRTYWIRACPRDLI